jgi:hypothetical protein
MKVLVPPTAHKEVPQIFFKTVRIQCVLCTVPTVLIYTVFSIRRVRS